MKASTNSNDLKNRLANLLPSLFCGLLIFGMVITSGCSGSAGKSKPENADQTGDQQAKVGVGKKQGEGYGDNVPLLKPASEYWKIKEKIAFDIVLKSTLRLYEATNGPPKSNEEFMEKVIRDGKVKLPELPDRQEYFYDIEKKQLMVRSIDSNRK